MTNIVHDIKIDYSRDSLFDELGLKRLKESYMREDEQSPQERFAYVSSTFGSNADHAQRLYEYSSKHWLSYSTPILSFGRSKRGLPISCFLNYIEDSAEGLVDNLSETNWLSMLGGGVGIGRSIHAGMVAVADGTDLAAEKLARVLVADPGMGVIRHADAGYDRAIEVADQRGVRLPMREG